MATPLYIGISGHCDINQDDKKNIIPKLEAKIEEIIEKYSNTSLKFIVGEAEGIDDLVKAIIKPKCSKGKIEIEPLGAIAATYEDDTDKHTAQAESLVNHSREIIVVWDGIFNYKQGGTSDIVRRALNCNKDIILHHLVCPRESNPFPVNSLATDAIDHKGIEFNRIPFTVSFSWTVKEIKGKSTKGKLPALGGLRDLYGFLVKIFRRQLFWYFMIPIILSIVTIVAGTYGFRQLYCREDFANNFFRAVNLITLNASVIDYVQISNGEITNLLKVARITGLFTIISGFVYALLLALKDVREDLIRFVWRSLKRKVVLVIGLNEKSYHLIKSLSNEPGRIVVLTERENSVYDSELKQIPRLIVVHGSISSATMLRSVYAMEADKIFIMSDNETKNVRAAQELGIMCERSPTGTSTRIFVHIRNDEYVKLLRTSLNNMKNIKSGLFIFNIYENSVRRLFLHFPPDRFYQSPSSNRIHAIIIGYDEIGKEILLTLLKQGHYQPDKKLEITVYCKEATACRAAFSSLCPLFFANGSDRRALRIIKEDTWRNIQIRFLELPRSDFEWLNDKQPIYCAVGRKDIVNIYTGLTDGIESASYLNTILPKLNILKTKSGCDVQVFCYYNFPDEKEEKRIEDYLNELAPGIFVRCFGNFVRECSADAIQSMALDEMAKLINAFYSFKPKIWKQIRDNRADWLQYCPNKDINEKWYGSSSKDKMSSQQAGDHLWTKLRIIRKLKEWNFDNKFPQFKQNDLSVLGEIEHRRWCAELLLQGFVPFEISPGSNEYKKQVKKWKNPYKEEMQSLRRHISLVPYDQLMDTESKKDHDQIKAIPYFLARILPSVFNKNNNNRSNQVVNMKNKPDDLSFLLMYAARIDTNISDTEKEIIMKYLESGEETWEDLCNLFEAESEIGLADKVNDILHNASAEQRKEWLQTIKQLTQSDKNLSGTEQYLLSLIGKKPEN